MSEIKIKKNIFRRISLISRKNYYQWFVVKSIEQVIYRVISISSICSDLSISEENILCLDVVVSVVVTVNILQAFQDLDTRN